MQAYFSAPEFVGHEEQRASLRDAFAAAQDGASQTCIVSAQPGLGRSRLLNEFAVEARLAGATVISAQARPGMDIHEVVSELSMQLLAANPEAAYAAAAPLRATLGHLSDDLRQRLGR